MSTILITGTSGFIGKALAVSLSQRHQVIGLTRKNPGIAGITNISGDFADFEDLRKLDTFKIETAVHLASVTGGCSERDGIRVNVEGTRCLMRYLIDQGCRKFVMASSIAAVGLQNPNFRPLQIPISDQHPCLDNDGYGLSKCLMEEVTRYYQRQNPDLDVIDLRLAAVSPDESPWPLVGTGPLGPWALASLSVLLHGDAVRAFACAAEAPFKSGLRIMNATAPMAWSSAPTAAVLRNWWGDAMDLSCFEREANTYASAFDSRRIFQELGFTAEATCKHIAASRKGCP